MAIRMDLFEAIEPYQQDKDFEEYMEWLEQFLLANDILITGDHLTATQKAKPQRFVIDRTRYLHTSKGFRSAHRNRPKCRIWT